MLPIFKLSIAALIPVVATLVFLHKDVDKKISSMNYWVGQIIYGVVFGMIAILGTEWGIKMNGYFVNCRDAAPMIAGLLFGGPAGIIAGFIGGLERWLAVYWGAGEFTRIACTLSTCVAGFYAAFLRKYFFENKRPKPLIGCGCGFVIEVFHLSMVFFTNIGQISKALEAVKVCFAPMVISVTVSVWMACALSMYLDRATASSEQSHKPQVFERIQRHLLLSLMGVSVIMIILLFVLQNNLSKQESQDELRLTLENIELEIENATDAAMIATLNGVCNEIVDLPAHSDVTESERINELCNSQKFVEINIIDVDGVITESTVEDYVGFAFNQGNQAVDFYDNVKARGLYLQPFQRVTIRPGTYRRYVGKMLPDGRCLQIGYDSDGYKAERENACLNLVKNHKIGEEGGIIVFNDENQVMVQSIKMDLHQGIERVDGGNINSFYERKMYEITVGARVFYAMYSKDESFKIFALVPKSQEIVSRDISILVSLFMVILVFAILFGVVYFLFRASVVRNILKVEKSLSEISSGNLSIVVDVRDSAEFDSLSDDINTTVDTLKNYIDEAARRIDEELEFAKNIQLSSLPNVFPAFPNEKAFDIYACMRTAKEVGGDFYDFYMTDKNTLNFLIADVSGKGIPAAMFMMRSKAILKSTTERVDDIESIFYQANMALCAGNDADMFLTAWQGKFNTQTGELSFVSAGHNPPVLKHVDGTVEFVSQKTSFVLAGMEGMRFKPNTITLKPGEILFLYTDGVTEATDIHNELYGDDRLLSILSGKISLQLKDVCDSVKRDIDIFVKGAAQFDDITMVAFKYNGPNGAS